MSSSLQDLILCQFIIKTSAVPVRKMYSYRKVGGLSSFFMDGQMRLCLKVGQGYLGLL